ncbi:MAG: mannose-1-phosphate guanylyltransferase/mannose-6-phosphate isomerase [Pseudomonadales bacterium]|nr:mannose-1-phosphate guanylyltransferase/mannose-6-phosphate isomerase [Pseudomonadales bacterium]
MLVPVILAGGVGSRLWPLSREHYPKQFIPLIDEKLSLMQTTIQRLAGVPGILSPMIVCNEDHRFMVAEQLRKLEVESPTIILEPAAKNTAPADALAALKALAINEKAILLVLPADHLIRDNRAFHQAIAIGKKQAIKERLVTFGVTPTGAETGYGYIRSEKPTGIPNEIDDGALSVAEFVEKPNLTDAQRFVASGDYYWNSGMFMFTAKAYLEELGKFAPDILQACENSFRGIQQDLDFDRVDAQAFKACRSESIDYAVMEHTGKAVMVPLNTDWNDVGAWDAIWDVTQQDELANVAIGDVIVENVRNSYLRAESRMIAAVGIDNLVVVETADAILVADRNQVQQVKAVVDRLKRQSRREVTEHTQVFRPWGSYESIVNAHRFQAKRIIVNPGASLSLQLHHHRAEHWVVVKGCALVTRGEEEFRLNEDESTYIPIGMKHRLMNPGIIPLEIIEVQTGSYLGEDDIVRFDDKYGRKS